MTRARWDAEDGAGIVLVLLVTLVMSMFIGVALASGQTSMRQSRDDQDRQAALAAAEAGADDYAYRLNRNDVYWQYNAGNLPATDPADPNYNAALVAVDAADPAAGWAPVAGGASEGSFHYEHPPAPRDPATTVASAGTVIVRVTGRVRSETRTLEVTFRQRSVLDSLYFTDFETLDPGAYAATTLSHNPGPAYDPQPTGCTTSCSLTTANAQLWASDNCRKHAWEGRHTDCVRISFVGNSTSRDVIRGPFHTNDTFLVKGDPQWTARATTSDPSGTWTNAPGSTGATPSFPPGSPSYRTTVDLPPSNTEIKLEADKAASPPGKGCLYSGPTEIRLEATSPGTMLVRSPYTPAPSTNPPSVNAGCVGGDPNTFTRVNLPQNGVVYVQAATRSCDVSQTAGQPERNPLGYPQTNDLTAYGCIAGDAFVRGRLRGQLTIAAANNINIVGDLVPDNPASGDLLGLVAQNFIQVYHPVKCTSTSNGVCTAGDNLTPPTGSELDDPDIGAALLSMQHSFRVQNHHLGAPKGTLNVTGAIAQLFRGVVGTSNSTSRTSGYAKNYVYDERLAYLSPPAFIDPLEAPWETRSVAEIAPQY